MTDQRQTQHDPSAEVQQSTISQGQEAMEQAIDLQRNVARMALSAMQWQRTAQRQGVEMTTSMLQGFPGQQFTESMMESYLQALEAVVPEMERAVEKGMRAASQPPTPQGQLGGQQMGGQQQMGGEGMERQRMGGQQRGQQSRQMGEQRMESQQIGSHRMEGQQSRQMGEQGRRETQQPRRETGEWVSQAESYGGEPAGSPEQYGHQQPMEGQQSRRHEAPREEPIGRETRRGSDRPMEGRQGERRNEGGRSAERRRPPGQGSERGHPEERYSRRIDADRGGQERERRPVAQGQQRRGARTQRPDRSEHGREEMRDEESDAESEEIDEE